MIGIIRHGFFAQQELFNPTHSTLSAYNVIENAERSLNSLKIFCPSQNAMQPNARINPPGDICIARQVLDERHAEAGRVE
jgi:hypothetical protein